MLHVLSHSQTGSRHYSHYYSLTLVAGTATTDLQDCTNHVQSHDHVDASVPKLTAGYSHFCQTNSLLVYSPTAYCSLHPVRLCQTILLFHLTNSQYPVQSIASYLKVKTKDTSVQHCFLWTTLVMLLNVPHTSESIELARYRLVCCYYYYCYYCYYYCGYC